MMREIFFMLGAVILASSFSHPGNNLSLHVDVFLMAVAGLGWGFTVDTLCPKESRHEDSR